MTGEVSKTSWFMLAVLVVFNYIRIIAVDYTENDIYCPQTHSGEPCFTYILSYALFTTAWLTLFVFGVYVASCYTVNRIYLRSFQRFQVPIIEGENNRMSYQKALEIFALIERKEDEAGQARLSIFGDSQKSSQKIFSYSPPSDVWRTSPQAEVTEEVAKEGGELGGIDLEMVSLPVPPGNEKQQQQEEAETRKTDKPADILAYDKEVDEDEAKEKEEQEKYDKEWKHANCWGKLYLVFIHTFFPLRLEHLAMESVFFFHSPDAYFGAVEFVLLLQCFFISVWATQLLPLATADNNVNAGAVWGFFLTFPVFINFFLIRLILNRAVILQGFYTLTPRTLMHPCTHYELIPPYTHIRNSIIKVFARSMTRSCTRLLRKPKTKRK